MVSALLSQDSFVQVLPVKACTAQRSTRECSAFCCVLQQFRCHDHNTDISSSKSSTCCTSSIVSILVESFRDVRKDLSQSGAPLKVCFKGADHAPCLDMTICTVGLTRPTFYSIDKSEKGNPVK
eukprot:1139970-Pelagomonas_calceolata.AAC.5